MTRAQREMLVERYQAFEMSAAEEQEFIIHAATDSEIHRILRASRLVQKALDENRAKMPTGHLDVRERALSLLAATPAPQASTPAEASAASSGTRRISRRTAGWMSHAAIAVVFAVGGYLAHDTLPLSTDARSRQVPTVSSPMPTAILPQIDSSRVEGMSKPVTESQQPEIEPSRAQERSAAPVVTGRQERGRPAAATSARTAPTAPGTMVTSTPAEEPRASTEVEPARTVAAPPVSKPRTSRGGDSTITFRGRINPPKAP